MTAPRPSLEYQLQLGLSDAKQFLGVLQEMVSVVQQSDQAESPQARQLWDVAREFSTTVRDVIQRTGRQDGATPILDRLTAGDLAGAAKLAVEAAKQHTEGVNAGFARLLEAEARKPVAQPAGTDLAARGPAKLSAEGGQPVSRLDVFMAAHAAAGRLVAAASLRRPIEGGDEAAMAHLALLTAIAEYGDKLLTPLPELHTRPPAGSPFQPVYDRVKQKLEHFQHGAGKYNLLNPGRLMGVMHQDREAGIQAVAASLQAMPPLKKEALQIATALRDAFESDVNQVFALTMPEPQALRRHIDEACRQQGVTPDDKQANLLMNPHLDPARCVADLATLIRQQAPDPGAEQAESLAFALRAEVNRFNQELLRAAAAALYGELGGEPADFAAETLSVGNMADSVGIPLTTGNKPGTPDYLGLFNQSFTGRLVYDDKQRPYYAGESTDAAGDACYRLAVSGQVGHEVQTALTCQPIKTEVSYEHPPALTVRVGSEAAARVEFARQGKDLLLAAGGELAAGVQLDAARGLLDLGPAWVAGQPYTVECSLQARDTTGDWEDFAVVLVKTVAPRLQVRAATAFEPARSALNAGTRLLTRAQAQLLARWLHRGATLELGPLLVTPAQPGPAGAELDIEHDAHLPPARGVVHVAIRVPAEAEPCAPYRHLTPSDPTGALGLAQDRVLMTTLELLAELAAELAADPQIQSRLRQLEAELNLRLIRPPGGTTKLP